MRLIGAFFSLCLNMLLIASASLFVMLYTFSKDLPDYDQLANYDPPIVTRLYAADGRMLSEYAIEKRLFVPISAIPEQVIEAFLSAEDKNFYTHPGIDLTGIFRAIAQNFQNMKQNRSLVGGSTITQQVVKNFLLTNEKSINRKIKEAILAFRINQVYSKDRILELYLNQIYLGSGSYGVAAASLDYFNKSLDELTIEEAALLAAMPKAPSQFDPARNYNRALERRDWVISRMSEDGVISSEEAMEALAKPIILKTRAPEEVVVADFFAESVRREIMAKYGAKTLYEGGLLVRTTIDPKMQLIAEKALREGLIEFDRKKGFRGAIGNIEVNSKLLSDGWDRSFANIGKPNGALSEWKMALILSMASDKIIIGIEGNKKGYIEKSELKWASNLKNGDVILVNPLSDKEYSVQQVPLVNGALIALDPHNGRVLAMMGGFSYDKSQFNRAIQAKRQPGSAFKPFVYLAAMEKGFTPATILLDSPVELSQGTGLPTWKPKNYTDDFLGPTVLRRGLEKSRNAMTVRLALMLGIDRIMDISRRFKIYENPQRNFSVVLGAAETTLLRMVNAYAMIANGGKEITPSLIEKIQDKSGSTIYRMDNRACNECKNYSDMPPELPDNRNIVTDSDSAYQLISMMEGVVQRGTATSAKKLGHIIAGKTGTTNDSLDTWFIGFTPDLVVGVYVGYDTPKSLGAKATGASVALPIFIKFMEQELKNKPDKPFAIPEGIKLTKIDMDTGFPPTESSSQSHVIFEAFKNGAIPSTPIHEDSPEPNMEGLY